MSYAIETHWYAGVRCVYHESNRLCLGIVYPKRLSLFFFSFCTLLLSSFFWISRGHRCRPFSPPGSCLQFFIAHRVQQSHCSSIFCRVLFATHALALSASQFVTRKKSPRIHTSMHSAGLELTKLPYSRLEDNLIRHRGDMAGHAVHREVELPSCRVFSVAYTSRRRALHSMNPSRTAVDADHTTRKRCQQNIQELEKGIEDAAIRNKRKLGCIFPCTSRREANASSC